MSDPNPDTKIESSEIRESLLPEFEPIADLMSAYEDELLHVSSKLSHDFITQCEDRGIPFKTALSAVVSASLTANSRCIARELATASQVLGADPAKHARACVAHVPDYIVELVEYAAKQHAARVGTVH